MKKNITPVIIIGAARNGTTNLENLIASLPSVAGVEHWLHHGSLESYIYLNHRYWGELNDRNNYLRFLYQYAGSDYFQQCKGSIEHHLEHPADSFYDFFLDLMDRYTRLEEKKYWTTKLDSCFFYDDRERNKFLALLEERYESVKFIRIQREFKTAFNSYRHMEGKKYALRQKSYALLPALMYQASRYSLIYNKKITGKPKSVLHIRFEDYVKEQQHYYEKIAGFLGTSANTGVKAETNRFAKNSSYAKQSKKALPKAVTHLIPGLLTFFRLFPALPEWIWKTYYKTKKDDEPFFRRLLKYRYFKKELIEELTTEHALDLAEKIKREEKAKSNIAE